MANEPKKPSFVKMRDVFQHKKNPKNPSLVENKDNYADTKKPFPEDITSKKQAVKGDSNSMRFRDLKIGDTFDFVDDSKPGYNSFFKKCVKISDRKYRDSDGQEYIIGSQNAKVFHVNEKRTAKMENSVKAHLAYLAGKNVEPKTAAKKTAGPLLERLQQQEGEGQSKIQQALSQLKGAFDKFRSLVFEVAPTGQVIEAAKSGEGVDLKIYPDKDSPTPSTEKKFDLNSFVNFFFQKIAPQNAEKVLSEILSKGFSSIAKPVFARVCANLRKNADAKYVEKAPYYIPDLEEDGSDALTGELSEEPMFLVNKTFEVITPESAEEGDAEERGFEFEDKQMSPESLASEIKNQGYSEWSNSDKTGWITYYDEEGDYRTGERINYSLHIKKLDGSELSAEDYAFIDHIMTGK